MNPLIGLDLSLIVCNKKCYIHEWPQRQHPSLSDRGRTDKIEVTLANDTVWLTADQIAELFQRNKSTISRHIKNVFESGELKPDSVVAKNATTAYDGKIYNVAYYNLNMIISVGYRVNSHRGGGTVPYLGNAGAAGIPHQRICDER